MKNLLSTKLTDGERALVNRRRCGVTQAEMGERLGYGRTIYALIERDRHASVMFDGVRFSPYLDPELLPCELLFLARRRSGLTLQAIGERLCVSRPTVLKWEDRGDSRLRAFWKRA